MMLFAGDTMAPPTTSNGSEPPRPPTREAPALARRLYQAVTVAVPPDAGSAFRILLDGKPARTPAKEVLDLPTRPCAEAVAAEWAAQREHIDPATMPLTKLVCSAIDGVRGREGEVREAIGKYVASDLLCYRASSPLPLVCRQTALWDPVLAWGRDVLGVPLIVTTGVMPVAQPEIARTALARTLAEQDAFTLAALYVLTSLMGSALLALAHAHGQLGLEEAWAAAHVDEDWQISQWGEDAQAAARREGRWREVASASRLLRLVSNAP
jgi:chaperone required for assembly of F1-ATPase